jgi:digeranylgeranylglycerophospholipid reductase
MKVLAMEYDYDLIVIGAGPGGSMAAKTAAEEGLDVLLIEKRQEIGAPVRCAEGVSRESIEEFFEIEKSWIAREVVGAIIYAPDGSSVRMAARMAGNEVGFVLERKIFDRALARMAAKAGADVLVKTSAISMRRVEKGVVVELKRMGENFDLKTRLVIGADGIESRVGKWAGIDTTLKIGEIESCIQYLMTGIDFDADYTHFWLGKRYAPGGYIWLFPKGEEVANVGIGVLATKTRKGPKAHLDEFVKERYPEAEIIEVVAGGVPVSGGLESAVADNVMLVGDAARHADPMTGGGIANAIKGGYFAGKVAKEAVKANNFSKEFLKRYDELWKSDFGETLRRNKIIQRKILGMDDETLSKIIRSVSGYDLEQISLRRLMVELIKKNPRILWDLKDLFF